MSLDDLFTNLVQDTLQIGDITIKSVSSVTRICNTIDSKLNFKEHINNRKKKHIINYRPQKTTKISNTRKSQNLTWFNDRNSMSLMSINLNVPLKSRYMQRAEQI